MRDARIRSFMGTFYRLRNKTPEQMEDFVEHTLPRVSDNQRGVVLMAVRLIRRKDLQELMAHEDWDWNTLVKNLFWKPGCEPPIV